MSAVASLEALATVFALIVLGAILRRSDWFGAAFWPGVERLAYFVLFPALIASTLAKAELGETPWPRIAIALTVPMVGIGGALAVWRHWSGVEGPRWTSLLQGAVRMNTYVGLAIASAVFGEEGLAVAAVAVAVIVPLVNVICVTGLARFGAADNSRASWAGMLARNPLILACLVGIGLNALGVGSPRVVGDIAEALGRASLPLGLLAVGAGLRLESLTRVGKPEAVVTFLKLLVLPGCTAAALWAAGVSGTAASVPIVFAALPTAPSAYVLARMMGGDEQAMASLIACQTLAATATLPAVLLLLA